MLYPWNPNSYIVQGTVLYCVVSVCEGHAVLVETEFMYRISYFLRIMQGFPKMSLSWSIVTVMMMMIMIDCPNPTNDRGSAIRLVHLVLAIVVVVVIVVVHLPCPRRLHIQWHANPFQ